MIKQIAVIGSGTMGNGIAHVCAQYGNNVSLIDISEAPLEKAIKTITGNFDRMVTKGIVTAADKDAALQRITTYTKLSDGVKNADLIIEAASENESIKLSIFKELDSVCKADAILATNTSSISITKIASVTKRPDKVIGMHFMNPVPVMKLIEVIRGYKTSDEVTKIIFDLSVKLNKIPCLLNSIRFLLR